MRLRQKKSLLDQAGEYVEAVRPQIESAVDKAMDYVEHTALPLLHEARDKAAPVIADARAKAGPALADARDKAAPYVAEAREKAAPIIASGAAYAAEKATVGANLAAEKAAAGRDLAAAKVAELQGKPVKKKGGKLKKLLLLGGLAAIAGAVAKKLQGNPAADNWQSSYVPTPAPRPSAPAPAATSTSDSGDSGDSDDTGGSSPDEALADQAEGAHPVTTPDDPAEVVDIDDAPSANGGNHKA